MNKMVNVNKKSVAFCRFSIAIMFWIIGITGAKILLVIPFIIMILSGILGVSKAPLVIVGNILFKKKDVEVVNVQSIKFAHYTGSIMTAIAIIFFYIFKIDIVGWIITWIMIVLQTIAAFGYCSAQKLFECIILGNNCCKLGKKIRGGKCNVR
ncbi:MAG: DUF4395 family protein [Clostridia bacterium]|nr:DUF4395 family protein [Clostridia bacterium]MDD4387052.1 DUF4395 family protein [Clostridia bacterium]